MHKGGCSARATSEGSSVVVRSEPNHPLAHSTLTVANMRKRAREETSVNKIYDEILQVRIYVYVYKIITFGAENALQHVSEADTFVDEQSAHQSSIRFSPSTS